MVDNVTASTEDDVISAGFLNLYCKLPRNTLVWLLFAGRGTNFGGFENRQELVTKETATNSEDLELDGQTEMKRIASY